MGLQPFKYVDQDQAYYGSPFYQSYFYFVTYPDDSMKNKALVRALLFLGFSFESLTHCFNVGILCVVIT